MGSRRSQPSPSSGGLLVAMLATVLAARDAHAYLDPATGSMVLQEIVGGAMACLFVVRRQWGQLKGWFTRRQPGSEASKSTGTDGDGD
jgi:hypothetical protein